MRDVTIVDKFRLTDKIRVTKRIHPVWAEWIIAKEKHPEIPTFQNPSIIGKFQYIYESETKRISLVELPNYFHDGIDWWEAMEWNDKGDLTHEEMRFLSKNEAEKEIMKLLE